MTPNATYHDIETLSGPSQLAAITKLTETNAQYTLNSNVAKFIKAATTYADLFRRLSPEFRVCNLFFQWYNLNGHQMNGCPFFLYH